MEITAPYRLGGLGETGNTTTADSPSAASVEAQRRRSEGPRQVHGFREGDNQSTEWICKGTEPLLGACLSMSAQFTELAYTPPPAQLLPSELC
ncbi:unnamed protein product [Arctogadus glacialis]